jgi:hypothetical protein
MPLFVLATESGRIRGRALAFPPLNGHPAVITGFLVCEPLSWSTGNWVQMAGEVRSASLKLATNGGDRSAKRSEQLLDHVCVLGFSQRSPFPLRHW